MASISSRPNGFRILQFIDGDGARKTIRLGKMPKKMAETIKVKVEALIAAVKARVPPDDETATWTRDLSTDLTEKLAAVGLVESRKHSVRTLKAFVDSYIDGRTDHKPNTKRNCRMAANTLVVCFGKEKNLREFTESDADHFLVWMKTQGLADATIGRRLKRAKQFFRAAVRQKLIVTNPFQDAKPPSQVNMCRQFFITQLATQKIIDACPDAQWRLIVALARYGGLRSPSEVLALRWGDVDWESGRIKVHSPKTEHLTGGASREIPLFPELHPYLEEAFELAEAGTVHVITRYRDAGQNLRTQFARIIRKSGLEPWPKPFQNLRSSRETELANAYPIHVVCAWIGNTERIAAKHYLQVTDEHFEEATRSAAKSAALALQKALPQASAHNCKGSQATQKSPEKPGLLQADATVCEAVPKGGLPPRGLEPLS
ncbi:MAG: tyrosine-type recombinase/integrase [Planctomycetes bacterium]|nr:tyrosine-type recombinase/integrase [Planctomycetota bacterium]